MDDHTQTPDDFDRLLELTELHRAGELTDEEFSVMKARLVGTAGTPSDHSEDEEQLTSAVASTQPISAPPANATPLLLPPQKPRGAVWLWLACVCIAVLLFGAGFAAGRTLFAPTRADATSKRQSAYDAAYDTARDRAYDRAYKKAYDEAYDEAYTASKARAVQQGRANGKKLGTARGRAKGAVKGRKAA